MPKKNEIIGPYRLIEKLGSGQFGVVWKAEKHEAIAPPCAIKFPTGDDVDFEAAKREAEVWVRASGHPNVLPIIEAGKFMMGSPASEEGRRGDEGPQHDVRAGPFLMGKDEVTQRQWRAVAGLPGVAIDLNADPSRFKGDDLPVENVSWDDAKEFIARLNRKLGLTEQTGYRLPSEAEWEYAARAGTTTPFAFGATITPDVVNYNGNYPYGGASKGVYREKTVNVGSLGKANGWGIFDMHGNVWEWCEDDWHGSYDGAPADGRAWIDVPSRGSYRVDRGGGWSTYAVRCRSAHRNGNSPGGRSGNLGFRLLRTLP